ncbi:MAG: radical SAM protein [Gammaproteobacteria bacterium]
MTYDFSDPRLSDLKQRYPETPDSIILKADMLREGIRYTEALAEIGQWAIPSGTFLSREDIPGKEPGGKSIFLLPNQMILADDTRINTELDRSSPYTIRKEGDDAYAVCRHDRPVAEVSFPRRPTFTQTLSDGSPIERPLGQRAESCAALVHTAFCEYAKNNDQCAFCRIGNASVKRRPSRHWQPNRSIEACGLAAKQIDIRHIVVSGGAFVNTTLEAKSYAKTISALRKAVGPEARITAVCQAFDEAGWIMLKDAGASRVQPNLEVWDERLWKEIVPGKAKAVGKAEWVERLKVAVDIFGVGEVATNFVAGAELAIKKGFAAPEDAIESHLEGYTFLLDHNIVPVFGFLTKGKGTRYEGGELPTTEFYLTLGWERTQLMKASGMSARYGSGIDADFSCYKCVTHKTCQDYPRLLKG